MPQPDPIFYHFEEDSNPSELRRKSEYLFRMGWRKAGSPRQIEMKLPGGRNRMHYSQAFSKSSHPFADAAAAWQCFDPACPAEHSRPDVFWGEIAPCEHVLQIYDDDEVFLGSLERFARAGLVAGEAVVIIATPPHRAELERRLAAEGLDVAGLREEDRYLAFDAAETLARFMRKGWPDETLFRGVVGEVLQRARRGHRRVRAFGEMVALLWAQGDCGATVCLEHCWHVVCQLEDLPLFCAYPRAGFTKEAAESLRDICAAHSRLVG